VIEGIKFLDFLNPMNPHSCLYMVNCYLSITMMQQKPMDEITKLNIVFKYLYKNSTQKFFSEKLEPLFISMNEGRANCQRLLEQLLSDGYIYSEKASYDVSHVTEKVYAINSKGIFFIQNLPKEYAERPYFYHLELQKEKQELDSKIKIITLSSLTFQRRVTYITLFLLLITAFIPLLIWRLDKLKDTKIEIKNIEIIKDSTKILK
jgi:hypothetical protein